MLIGKVLNSDATINSFYDLGSLQFIPGEQTILVIRLIQAQRSDKLRYIPENPAAEVNVFLPKTDGTDLEKSMTAFTLDKSVWYVTLEEAETELLADGNFTFEVDELGDGTNLKKGWIQNGLSRIITGGGAC